MTNAEYACFMEARGYKDEQWWQTELAKRWSKGEEVTGGQLTTLIEQWNIIKSLPNLREQLTHSGNFTPEQIDFYEEPAKMSEDEVREALGKSLSGKSRQRPQYWNDADRNNLSQSVMGITWFEANAYCAWLSNITGRQYRLLTEVEWEAAVRDAQRIIEAMISTTSDRSEITPETPFST